MSNNHFDVVTGVDELMLNTLTASIYNQAYPMIFKASIPIGQFDISTVDYDISQAPTFSLNPSNLLMDSYREMLKQDFQSDELEMSVVEVAQASFDVTFSTISVTVNYSNEQHSIGPINVSIVAAAQAVVNPDNSLSLRLLRAALAVPGDPTLSQILTDVFAPQLVDYLNAHLLAPVALPALNFDGVSFSVPVILTQGKTLLVCTSLQPAAVVPPDSGNWPQGTAFIAADAMAINAVVDSAISTITPSRNWSWSYTLKLGFFSATVELDAQYNLSLSAANFMLVPGQGSDVTASFAVSGSASFSAKTHLFQATFGANITGTVTATATIEIIGQQVTAIFKSLENTNVNINFFGVPGILNPILSPLADALVPELANALASAYPGKSFPLTTIQTISFSLGGVPFTVTPDNLALKTISGPNGIPLLTATSSVRVQKGLKTTHVVQNRSVPVNAQLQRQEVAS